MRAPVPREIAASTDPGKELVKRSLNAAEREEISQYIRQVRRLIPRLLFFLIPYTSICVMLLLNWIRSREHRLVGLVGPVVGPFFIVPAVRQLALAFRRSTLLSRDLAAGWVITVQSRPRPDLDVGEVAPPSAPPQEFLLMSGMVWTENGRPASWRDLVRFDSSAAHQHARHSR